MNFMQILLSPYLKPSAFYAYSLLFLHFIHINRVLRIDFEAVECLLLDSAGKIVKDSQFLSVFESLLLSLKV